jgi:flagellar biosynthesis protein FlhF
MSFKRFVAANTRDAMALVRRELGEDAVILSNKRIANGHIEILAAGAGAVEAIVEEVRKPARAAPLPPGQSAVEIAPGVKRVGPAVQSFQEYLQRGPATVGTTNTRSAAPATVGAASMYSAVASADAAGLSDDGGDADWADSRFDARLSAHAQTRAPQTITRAAPATATGAQRMQTASRPMSSPALDTWLPNEARADARAQARPQAAVQSMPQPMPQATQSRTVAPATAAAATEPPAVFRRRPSRELQAAAPAVHAPTQAIAPAAMPAVMPVIQPAAVPAEPVAAVAPPPVPVRMPDTEIRLPAAAPESVNAQLMAEIASLRASLQAQLASLSSTVAATDSMRRNPLQTRVMTRLLTSGFSVEVARRVALNTPELADADAADAWLQDVVAHNLRCADVGESIVDRAAQGGCHVYALVGPTGVGKTTTVAKLAARFAVKYGTSSLGLVTLDAYRVAAHEQLRTYGRILGTPVHLAQDAATLRELLMSMQGKKLVLIDTCGVGPRDERLGEMLATLAQAGNGIIKVKPVLLLNAASHAETLDDTARAWRAHEAAGTILTKLDEAARIGGALDCALRHKLKLLALTNGQRVPEDLHQPNARLLAHLALKPSNQQFALAEDEGAALAHMTVTGAVHA